MNQSNQRTENSYQQKSYHESMFNYIMDSSPYTQEMQNDKLPFFTSFGAKVYNQSQLVDIESDLKGQTTLTNRCDNKINTKLGQ